MKDIQDLINRIQQARAQSMSLPQEQLRALADEYCRRCEEIAGQVLYAHSLLRHKKNAAFLAFYREHPHLTRACGLLDMRGRADWITITQFLGCPPPPDLPLEEALTVRRAYEERRGARKKPETIPAVADEDTPAGKETPGEIAPEPPPLPEPVPLEASVLSLYETDGLRLPSPGDVMELMKKEPPGQELLQILPGDALPAAPPLREVVPPPVIPPSVSPPVTPPPLPETDSAEPPASPAAAEPPEKLPPDEDEQRFMDIFTPQPPDIAPPPVRTDEVPPEPPPPPNFPVFPEPVKEKPPKEKPETPREQENSEPRHPEKRVCAHRKRRRVLLGCLAVLGLLAGGGYYCLESHGISVSALINTLLEKAAQPDEKPEKSPPPEVEAETPEVRPDGPKIRDVFAAGTPTQKNGPELEPEKPRELIIPDTEDGRQTRLRYEKAGELVAQIPAAVEYESAEYPRLAEPCQRAFRELWPYRDLVDILPVSYTKKFRFIYEKTDNRWILRHESDRTVPPRGDYVYWNEEGFQIYRRHEDEQAIFFTGVLVRTKSGPGLKPRETFFPLFPRLGMVGMKPGEKIGLLSGEKNTYDFSCHGLAYALAIRDVPAVLRANYFLEDLPGTTVAVFSEETASGAKSVGTLGITPTKMTLAPEPRRMPELERRYEIRYRLGISPPELHVEIVPAENEEAFFAKADRACRAEVARLLAALEESLSITPTAGNTQKYAQDTQNLLENLATLTEKQLRDTQNRWLQDALPDAAVKIMEEIMSLLLHRLTVARKTFYFRMELHAAIENGGAGVPETLPILDTRVK